MMPDFLLESQNPSTEDASESVIFQTWQKSGSCPKGTIPIRRILKEDLLRASSLGRFGQKPPASLNFSNADSEFIPVNRSVYISINACLVKTRIIYDPFLFRKPTFFFFDVMQHKCIYIIYCM